MQHSSSLRQYATDVLGGRWPEAERDMIERGAGTRAMSYATWVMKQRWPEAEQVAMKMADTLIAEHDAAGDDEALADTTYERLHALITTMKTYNARILGGNWSEASELFRRIP